MDKNVDKVLPAKCEQCNQPITTPVVCDFCRALQSSATMADHFTLLGLGRRSDIDPAELHRKYVALSRHAHPDYHANDSPEVQQLHLSVSAAINDAYRTLKDPASRAAYLLELLGGASSAEDKSVPEGFLQTMMMIQEEIADARSAGDAEVLEQLREVLTTQEHGLLNRLAGLFEDLDQGASCQAVRSDLLGEIRRRVNAVSYVRKHLSLIPSDFAK